MPGATYQPAERAPEMTTSQLTAIRDAAASVAGERGVHKFDDFIIYNDPPKSDMRKLLARGLMYRQSELRKLMAQGLKQRIRAGLGLPPPQTNLRSHPLSYPETPIQSAHVPRVT
jgi:hypothetical protein